jgi:hypothetical protein
MNTKADKGLQSSKKSKDTGKGRKASHRKELPKKYQLRGLGWCGEITAHKLTPNQIKTIKAHAKKEGIGLDGLGNMEDILEDYNCYNTNTWQTGVLPFLHSSRYVLVNSDNKVLFSIETFENTNKGPKFQTIEKAEFCAKRDKGNLLVYCEEHKGTTAIWTVESKKVPVPSDFTFAIGKLEIDGDTTPFVTTIYFKGKELERDYDGEMIVGKAAYSLLI